MKSGIITRMCTNSPATPNASVTAEAVSTCQTGWIIWNPLHHTKKSKAWPKVIIPNSFATTVVSMEYAVRNLNFTVSNVWVSLLFFYIFVTTLAVYRFGPFSHLSLCRVLAAINLSVPSAATFWQLLHTWFGGHKTSHNIIMLVFQRLNSTSDQSQYQWTKQLLSGVYSSRLLSGCCSGVCLVAFPCRIEWLPVLIIPIGIHLGPDIVALITLL